MRRMKRFLAMILAASMLISTEATSVFATETTDNSETTERSETIGKSEPAEIIAEDIEDSTDETADGEIPPGGYRELPKDSEIEAVRYELGDGTELPRFFSALEEKYKPENLPTIRSQNPYGTCWAFSTIALAELDLMVQGVEPPDLSELHLAYFTYNSVVDPLGGTTGDKNSLGSEATSGFLDIGGNLAHTSRVLANWMGMTSEEKVPYSSAGTVETEGLAENLAYDDIVHLQNAYWINIKENPELVKQMIKEHGGAGISYYSSNMAYYNTTNNSYYVSDSSCTYADHAVVIVGWDDTFPKENFNTPPSGDGAWLIRNSWGSSGDELNLKGYFWLSYYDPSISEAAYVFDVAAEGDDNYYDNNYQYDGSMNDASYGMYESVTTANVFTARSGAEYEMLEAVSFSTSVPNQNYKVEVYRGLSNTKNPESGTLAAVEEGDCTIAGIYTVELSNSITLEEGESFSVVVTITAQRAGDDAYIDAESTNHRNTGWFECDASACAGQSFAKSRSGSWSDFGASNNVNFRIKAFTNNLAEQIAVTGVSILSEDVELGIGEEIQLTAQIQPGAAFNQKRTWSSSDKSVATVDAFGKVTACGLGETTITVCTEDGGFTDSIKVTVTKKLVSISLDTQELDIVLHESAGLTVSYNPEDTITDKTVTWESTNPSAISVDSNGVVTANDYGYGTIVAKVADKEAEREVYVLPPAPILTTKALEDGSAELSWDEAEKCTSYDIYRYDSDSATTSWVANVEDGTTYIDETVQSGVRYLYYVVRLYSDNEYWARNRSNAEPITYSITYVLNGGINSPNNPTGFGWNQPQFALEEPQHEAAVFEGWYYDSAFTKKVGTINPYSTLKNITVYAKWREKIVIQPEWLIYSEIQDYTGTEFKPTVVVKNGSKTLVEETDYEVSYVNKVVESENKCDVTITGIGEYIGSRTVTVTERKTALWDGMVSEIAAVTFTGTEVTPKPEVTFNGTKLVEGTDYTLTYTNNVNTGTATITITGKGHFEGSVTKNFKILSKSLENSFVETVAEQEYTGAAIKPEVVLTYKGTILQKNVDYSVSYRDNVQAGLATITIKGKGNYFGTVTATFTIVGADLATLETQNALRVLLAGTDAYEVFYSGEEITPVVSVSLSDGTQLNEETDYTISFEDNQMPGTAKAVISGIGNYSGTLEKTFTIKPYNIADANVTLGKKMTVLYAPEGQTPLPRVMYEELRLSEGTDYEAAYYRLNDAGQRIGTELTMVTDAGRYELVLKGIGIFTGTLDHASEIVVKARSLENGSVTIENPYARIDGDIVRANYKLLYRNQMLTEGVDYTATPVVSENRQYVTYVFEGKGNYAGTLTQKFLLMEADIILFAEGEYQIGAISDQTYTGEEICPAVTVTNMDDSVTLTQGKDYTVAYYKNVNTGTASVVVTGIGNCVGTIKAEFEILPMDKSRVTVEADAVEFVYDTRKHVPRQQLKVGERILQEGTDYTVSCPESKNAGDYQAVMTLKGNYTGTLTFDYRILPKNVEELSISVPDQVYTGIEILPPVEDMAIDLQGRTLVDDEKAGLAVTAGANNIEVSVDEKAEVTIRGTGNYTGETVVPFRIIRKNISDSDFVIKMNGTVVAVSNTGYQTEWSGSAKTPEIEIWLGSKKLVQDEDYSLTYRYNTDVGTARAIIYGKNNYKSSRTLFFEIVGKQLAEESGLTVTLSKDTFVYQAKAQCPVVTVSYGDRTLLAGTDYHVSYENNNNAGTAKAIVTGIGHYAGSVEKEFTIKRKTLEDAETVKIGTISKQRYSGELLTPDTSIEIDGKKLVQGTDYTVTVLNGIDAGTATWIASGIGNYEGVLSEQKFEIYYTTITYVLNGGVNSENNPSYYTVYDNITLENPTRDAYNFAGWYSDKACTKRVYGIKAGSDGNKTFYAKWTPKKVYGIDVSKWQGNIDWSTVSRTDKVFSMIRLSHGTTLDPYFETNYSGARNAGVKVGVYCYNEASTIQGAINEANYVVSVLNGRKLDYPVAYDLEGVPGIDNALRTSMVYAFKNVIEKAGYEFILYANKNWMDNYFDSERLAPLDLWIARYCDYNLGHRYKGPGNVRIWQYSSSGSVNGISGRVDLDVCYEDYVKK